MLRTIQLIVIIACVLPARSQHAEFTYSSAGLIYPDSTIHQLKFIVDSLHLKFRVCELNKTYTSNLQGIAHFISIEKLKVAAAKKDIENNISFEDFISRYKGISTEKKLLVVKFKYTDYDKTDMVEFRSVGGKEEHEIAFKENEIKQNTSENQAWVFRYYPKTEYSDESIDAFYFPDKLQSTSIPENYARMIQYSDCMVDTTTQVFYETAHRSYRFDQADKSTNVSAFMDYVHIKTKRPGYDSKNSDTYYEKISLWDSLRTQRVDSLRTNDPVFNSLLDKAVLTAVSDGDYDGEFEEYAGRYVSKKTELELKRNRRVVGGCSQDQSPRYHAFDIAKLSAETVNWEIFLRSHLDIMNDRFERVSDGSYAWEGRKTYIKELEVLDINVDDLLLGICLRIDNPSRNHYFGNIGRIGRALSESNQKNVIEAKMLEMIANKDLDFYNRVLMYYLFVNYNYYNTDKVEKTKNKSRLLVAAKDLPSYITTDKRE